MKNKHIIFGSIVMILIALTTLSFKRMILPIQGKWQVKAKIEQKIQNGVVLETNEKNYKEGKKTFEFAADNKLMIVDDYGKSKEKKKYVIEGNKIYIGKEMHADNLYTCTFSDNNKKVTLFRTKTKTKEGKTTVETDELRLERMSQ